MLTIYDFNGMDDTGKGNPVFQEGTFIDNRNEAGLKVQLYRLYSFYVEIFYHTEANEIIRYRAFKSIRQLAPYIKLADN